MKGKEEEWEVKGKDISGRSFSEQRVQTYAPAWFAFKRFTIAGGPGEVQTLEKYLRNATNFFEFGTGASTVPLASSEVFVLFCWARYLAMRFPNLHIHSVELDGSWVSNLASAWPLLGSLCRVSLSRPAHYANSRHDCKSFSCVVSFIYAWDRLAYIPALHCQLPMIPSSHYSHCLFTGTLRPHVFLLHAMPLLFARHLPRRFGVQAL